MLATSPTPPPIPVPYLCTRPAPMCSTTLSTLPISLDCASWAIFTPLMNPTTDVLEQRVAALEGGAAGLGIASGTSAVFYSIINIAEAGDEIVSANNLYGGTYTQFNDILPKLGIKVNFVDPNDPQNFAAAITPKTKALFCESVTTQVLMWPT